MVVRTRHCSTLACEKYGLRYTAFETSELWRWVARADLFTAVDIYIG